MIKVNRNGSFVNEKDKIVNLHFISGEGILQTIVTGYHKGNFDNCDTSIFLPMLVFMESINDYK